jgi:cytoskeletal protein CcmA (bactofilin family)
MASVTVIGRGAHVTGRVTGAVDLEIHGRVDGEVTIDGELTVEAEGLVAANLSARRLVVRGAVKGDLSAVDAVVLENGARVVGDVRAPRIAIERGALVRGYVQTGSASAASAQRSEAREAAPRAKPQAAAARPAAPAARATPKTQTQARPAPVAARAPAPAPASRTAPVAHNSVLAGGAPTKSATLGAGSAPPRGGPPAPVVPVLKKGSKGALKKKAG